ncbi:hypothetical protein pipiens_020291, partial [Culex pipiens pipiens]
DPGRPRRKIPAPRAATTMRRSTTICSSPIWTTTPACTGRSTRSATAATVRRKRTETTSTTCAATGSPSATG